MPVQSPPGAMALAPLFDPAQTPPRAMKGRPFHLRLLDGFRLEQHDRALSAPQAACRLMAFVGIRGRSSRTEIAGSLWPEVSEAKAHASLRTTLWRLRQMTDDPLLVGGQVLSIASTVEVDVVTLVATAQRLLTAGPTTDPLPAGRVRGAGLIVVGELLPGWYEDWVLFERERLRQLQMHALEAAALWLTTQRRHGEAIEAALAAVRLEPLRESATRVLIMAHLAEHNVVEAVRCFEAFRAQLLRELGVAPTPDLERMALHGLTSARANGSAHLSDDRGGDGPVTWP